MARQCVAPPGVEEVFTLTNRVLKVRNADLLPVSATDDGLGIESDGAVSIKAPGLRHHGVPALLSRTAFTCGGSDECRHSLVDTAMAATADEDTYMQQPAEQALQ